MRAGGVKIFGLPGIRREARHSGLEKEAEADPCQKNTAAKHEVADQIADHLRSLYDDVLKQPVPGRFLALLQQLENASSRAKKDGV
jgi:hypothetical protein